jgi:hypothetical protein
MHQLFLGSKNRSAMEMHDKLPKLCVLHSRQGHVHSPWQSPTRNFQPTISKKGLFFLYCLAKFQSS